MGTLTTSFTGSSARPWVSRTHTMSPPGVARPSAYRNGPSGVIGTGSPPGSSRYRRWSSKLEKNAICPWSSQAPPPYSCTLVRTSKEAGVTSSPSRTSTVRPSASGRRSSHQAAPSSARTGSDSRMPLSATWAAPIGEGQEP